MMVSVMALFTRDEVVYRLQGSVKRLEASSERMGKRSFNEITVYSTQAGMKNAGKSFHAGEILSRLSTLARVEKRAVRRPGEHNSGIAGKVFSKQVSLRPFEDKVEEYHSAVPVERRRGGLSLLLQLFVVLNLCVLS